MRPIAPFTKTDGLQNTFDAVLKAFEAVE